MDTLSAPLAIPVSTTFDIPGRSITGHAGPAFGLIARSTGFSKGFKGSIKAFRQGEVTEFTGTLEEARRTAIDRLVEHAQELGGNAVVVSASTPPTWECSRGWPRSSPTARPSRSPTDPVDMHVRLAEALPEAEYLPIQPLGVKPRGTAIS